MTVFKYGARVREEAFTVAMPERSQLLSVQLQHGFPHIWACVSEWKPTEDRWFRWYGTGHVIDVTEGPVYVGTVQIESFVWHLFEVKPHEAPVPVDFNDPRIT